MSASPAPRAACSARKLATMFLVLLKIGALSFGGGWSVGRSLPGIMIINIGVLFGHHVGGVLGGVLAAFAIAIPSIVTLCVVALFYGSVKDNAYVQRMLVGVRASVVPIVIGAALKLREGALVDKTAIVIAAIGFALCLSGRINNLLLVLAAGVAGLIIQGRRATR